MVAGVVGDGFRLAMFGEGLGSSRRIRGAFAEFSLAPFSSLPEGAERAGLSFQVGGMEELDGLLDTSGAGVFGRLRARTAFAGLGFSGELPGDWRVRAGGFAGRTAAEDGGGWFSPVEDLWSGAYALGLERDNVFVFGRRIGISGSSAAAGFGGIAAAGSDGADALRGFDLAGGFGRSVGSGVDMGGTVSPFVG